LYSFLLAFLRRRPHAVAAADRPVVVSVDLAPDICDLPSAVLKNGEQIAP